MFCYIIQLILNILKHVYLLHSHIIIPIVYILLLLVDVWTNESEIHFDWTLEIYGQGKDKAKLVKLISEFNSKSIELHSPMTNIKQHYMDSSIFVMTISITSF